MRRTGARLRAACGMALVAAGCDASDERGRRAGNLSDAASPSCAEVSVFPDEDGDGVHADRTRGEPITVCPGDEIPAGSEAPGDDCDDEDPSVWRTVCADRDGDGAASLDDTSCAGADTSPGTQSCPIVVEWTPDPGPVDCDDSDPNLIDFFYRDEDLDGYGAGDPVCWRDEVGWSAWGEDCADDDANTAPYKVDIAGDGLDGDCDGTDVGPCVASLDEFEWTGRAAETCSGPDLALGVVACSSCFRSSVTFAVENRGLTRVSTGVSFDAVDLSLSVDLAPGERTLLVSGPFADMFTLGFSDPGFTDCNPEDNQAYVERGHCL